MTTREERLQVLALVQEAAASGARQAQVCAVLGLSERTLQRWQQGETVGHLNPDQADRPDDSSKEVTKPFTLPA